jgi:hypothetical protein
MSIETWPLLAIGAAAHRFIVGLSAVSVSVAVVYNHFFFKNDLDFDCVPIQATPADTIQAGPSPPPGMPGQHDSDARPNKRAQSSEGEGDAIMPVWEAHEARLKLLQAACDVRSGMGEVCRNGSLSLAKWSYYFNSP